MLCPRCEQDDVLRVVITQNNQELFFCPECEAQWLSVSSIRGEKFFDFVTYMRTLGLSGKWSEVTIQPVTRPEQSEARGKPNENI